MKLLQKIKGINNLNLYDFIKLNYFSKNIFRKKGCYIYPAKHSIISISKSAKIYLNGNFQFNFNRICKSKVESYLILENEATLTIDDNVRLNYGATIHINNNAKLHFSRLTSNVGLNIQCSKSIIFGYDCMIGRNVTVFDSSFHPTGYKKDNMSVNSSDVIIGNHVWIGAYSFVMEGSQIGDNCIIGTNSYIRGYIKDGCTITSVPSIPSSCGLHWARSILECDIDDAFKYSNKNKEVLNQNYNEKIILDIKNKIIETLSLSFDGIDFVTQNNLIDDKIIDSLDIINLVDNLEKTFSIDIPFFEIAPNNFNNAALMAQLIYRLRNHNENLNFNCNPTNLKHTLTKLSFDESHTQKSVVERIIEYSISHPNDEAVICDDIVTTYEELVHMIKSIAFYLKNKGIKKGDCVAVQAMHSPLCVASYYAVHLLSAILVPIEKTAPKERTQEIMDDTKCNLIISNILIDNKSITYKEIKNIVNEGEELDITEYPNINDPCEMVFTTGTTGKSKGVLISHFNISWYSYATAKYIDMKKGNKFFITTPLNHAGGLRRTHLSLANGCTLVYMDGISDLNKYFDYIKRYNVTSLYLPPVAIRLLVTKTGDYLSNFKDQIDFVYSSSSPIPEGDCEKLKELLPNTRLYNAYEASETPGVSAYNYNVKNPLKNCMGKPNYGVEFGVLDENGNISREVNKEGQLCIKSKMNMMRYYNADDLTKNVYKDGWFISNDLGYIDENGNIYYNGRKGDVINVGGYKISPIDVEEVALLSGLLKECICVSDKDKFDNTILKLLVVPINENYSDIKLMEFMSKKLEGYKLPKKIEIIEKVEKTFNGKINRKFYR